MFARVRLPAQRSSDAPANNSWRVKITSLPATGSCRSTAQPVTAGAGHLAGQRHQPRVNQLRPAGRQRQRLGVRQLHLPGAGRRRHGQRRRRYRRGHANTITINVNAGQRRPERRRQDGHDAGRHSLHPSAADFGFSDPTTTRPTLHGREDHHAAGRRHADRSTARRSTPGQFVAGQRHQRRPAPLCTRRPTPTARRSASFTFQVQDDGGTANSGVDLDPIAQHDQRQRHAGQRCPDRRQQARSRRTKTPTTRSGRPTSASAIRTTAPANSAASR